jgi:hypothetical protein
MTMHHPALTAAPISAPGKFIRAIARCTGDAQHSHVFTAFGSEGNSSDRGG